MICDLKMLPKLCASLKTSLPRGGIVFLDGDLASGKTTLVKSFVQFLKISDKASSPTFSLQNIYGGKVFHYDLYNKTSATFFALGLFEEFEKEGWHFVEWGDKVLKDFVIKCGMNFAFIKISKKDSAREYKVGNATYSKDREFTKDY